MCLVIVSLHIFCVFELHHRFTPCLVFGRCAPSLDSGVCIVTAMCEHGVQPASLWMDVVRALEKSDEARVFSLCPSLLTHTVNMDINMYVAAVLALLLAIQLVALYHAMECRLIEPSLVDCAEWQQGTRRIALENCPVELGLQSTQSSSTSRPTVRVWQIQSTTSTRRSVVSRSGTSTVRPS